MLSFHSNEKVQGFQWIRNAGTSRHAEEGSDNTVYRISGLGIGGS